PDGSTVLGLRYREHRIAAGKPELDGLPSTYVEDEGEADTLEVDLVDARSGLVVTIATTIFRDRPVIARSVRIRSDGQATLRLETAMSLSLDLPDDDWTLVHLAGAWARERHVVERPLAPGRQSIASVRGTSPAAHNPFVALRRAATTEAHGEVLAAALAYS